MRKLNFDNQNCYCQVLSVVDSKNRHKIEPYFDNFYDNLVIFTESATARFGTRKLIFGILYKKRDINTDVVNVLPGCVWNNIIKSITHIFNVFEFCTT